MNLFRGCSHGCIYCDSRSRCCHIGHDFEDIEVKENALELLENALRHKRKKCMIPFINDTEENISGILDMCAEANVHGVICFGMGLTLREGNREYFYRQLDRLMQLFHETCENSGILHHNGRIFRYLSDFEEKDGGRQLSLWDLE